MKNIYCLASLVIITAFFIAAPPLVDKVEAQEQEIQIHVFNFQPFYVVEDGKEPSGILVDYIKAMFERSKVSYSLKGYPAKRAYNNLADGKSNLFLGVKGVPELEGNVIYGNEKITQIDLRVYAREGTPHVKTKEELKGKKIITIRGYSYGGFIKYLQDPANNIELDPTDGHELAFKKLQGKRADYLLDYSAPAETTLKSVIIPGIQNHSISIIDIFIIMSKKTPDAENILKKLEQAFIELKKEGKLSNL